MPAEPNTNNAPQSGCYKRIPFESKKYTDSFSPQSFHRYGSLKQKDFFFLPDPRGAGLHLAFQFSYVRTSVRTLVSEIKFWSLHIH